MEKIVAKKKIWLGVLIGVISLMIIVGGVMIVKFVFSGYSEKEANKKEDKQEEQVNHEEEVNEANVTLEKAPSNSSEYKNLEDGEYVTEKGYTLVIQDGVASIDGHLIVNKTFSIPKTYQPVNSYVPVTSERCMNCLEQEVMEAFQLMKSDAASVGLNIYIASGYRSYSYQETLYNNYSAVSGVAGADTYSARAGHSEHQTGLCFDLNSVDDSFAYTDEGKWIQENAYLYGFVIRYPKGKEEITGYQYEPWHLRYVGKELAYELYHQGNWITMEEYYGVSSQY